METWSNPIFVSRHYKSFCVLHIERAASTDIKSIAALQVVMRSMMRGLGAPQPAKLWEIFASKRLAHPEPPRRARLHHHT